MFVTPFHAGLLAIGFVAASERIMNVRRRGPFGGLPIAARIAGTSSTFVVLLVEAVSCIAKRIRGQALCGL